MLIVPEPTVHLLDKILTLASKGLLVGVTRGEVHYQFFLLRQVGSTSVRAQHSEEFSSVVALAHEVDPKGILEAIFNLDCALHVLRKVNDAFQSLPDLEPAPSLFLIPPDFLQGLGDIDLDLPQSFSPCQCLFI
jgi:hypothetical protein